MMNMNWWYIKVDEQNFLWQQASIRQPLHTWEKSSQTTSNKSKSIMEGLFFPIRKFLCLFPLNPKFPPHMSVSGFRRISSACLGPSGTLWPEAEFLCPFYLKFELLQDMSVSVLWTFSWAFAASMDMSVSAFQTICSVFVWVSILGNHGQRSSY